MRVFPEKIKRALKGTLFGLMLTASVVVQSPGVQASEVNSTAVKEGTMEPPVAMDVVYGYQDAAKNGRFLPLKIELSSQSSQTFRGTLHILAMESGFQGYNASLDYDVYRCEYSVEIQPGKCMNKSVSMPLGAGVDQMCVRMLDEGGNEVMSKRLKLNLNLETAELSIGVLNGNPAEPLYFNGVGINCNTLRTKTIEMMIAALSTSELGLDQLDAPLVTDFDSEKLSGQQIGAVQEWVHKSGVLPIGTGDRGESTPREFGKEPLEQPLPQPGERVINMGVEYAVDRPGGTSIPLICMDIMLKGSTKVLGSDELSILSSVLVGNGLAAVAMCGFVGVKEFCQANISYINNLFTTLLDENKINGSVSAMDGSTSSQFWLVQGLIGTGNISNLPKMSLYVTLAVAYMALAGPGLYFFWRQRGMRQYYQLFVETPSLRRIDIVLLVGMNMRFTGLFFTYVTVKGTDRDEISETTFINMQAPYNKPYSVTLNPEYTLYPFTGSTYYNMGPLPRFTGKEIPSITIHYDGEGTRIRPDNVGTFNSKSLMMKCRMENGQQEGFTGDVNSFNGKVTGTLTSNYDREVDNMVVLLYNQMILIGYIKPGKTVSLDDMEVVYGTINSGYAVTEQIARVSRYEEGKDTRDAAYVQALERTNLLSFYMGNYLSGYHSETRVLGFSDEKGETGFLKSSNYETYGSTPPTSPIDVSYERDSMIYKSAPQGQPNVLSGECYTSGDNMYGLTPAMLGYYLGNDIEMRKLFFHQMSDEVMQSMRYYYTMPFAGDTYLYSYNTDTYDSIDTHVQSYDREALEPYLSPGNILIIEYVYDAIGDYTWNTVLPILIMTERSK